MADNSIDMGQRFRSHHKQLNKAYVILDFLSKYLVILIDDMLKNLCHLLSDNRAKRVKNQVFLPHV